MLRVKWKGSVILYNNLRIRNLSSVGTLNNVLAIRREDQSVWERRAPLGPSQVECLVREGIKVIVQPSNRRAYPMQMYQSAGAVIEEDISEASVIMGVKQVPIEQLIPNRTYTFFSHTIKAQEANMPLLDAILEKNIRLIDYEKMVDETGRRIVAFGKYAGMAGMINILHGIGLRLLALGHHTPFMHIGPAHNYRNTEMATQAVRDAGYEVALGMLPKSIGPLTFVFTGTGNVSQGAQKIFQNLPHEFVPVSALRKVAEQGVNTKIYGCVVSEEDNLVRIDGGEYSTAEYMESPERYRSIFAHNIAPYASVIINGIYWDIKSPRLITIPDAKFLLQPVYTPWLPSSVGSPSLPQRMIAICDVSADPGGSIEFVRECTNIDSPFCLYDANQNMDTNSFNGSGVLVCSIDNMPTQLPRESTDYFGTHLYPFLKDILNNDALKPFNYNSYCPAVASAVIASNGELTPNFRYITDLRNEIKRSRNKSTMDIANTTKKVLLLGAGRMSEPLVEYLVRDPNTEVIVASAVKSEADTLSSKYSNCNSTILDVLENNEKLDELIEASSIVVSLLPYTLHPEIVKRCIAKKTNMLTASYCLPKMKELHNACVDAGITVVNEVGLDPGIDHLLALECFHEVDQAGGKVESYISMCGGLPAPEYSDNPLRYKFSWSPRGVLLNTISAAKYIKDNQIIDIPEGGSLMDSTKPYDFLPGFALEGFPNRDSTKYKYLYNLTDAHTVMRGTIRYTGYSTLVKGLHSLGLINETPHPNLHQKAADITWRNLIGVMLGQSDPHLFYDNLRNLLEERVGSKDVADGLESLGLLDENVVVKCNTPLDTLSNFLSKKLELRDEERDLVILRNEIGIRWPDNSREQRGINLVCYGEANGYSAMAKTVGYPAAIACKMVMDGEIQTPGMVLPFTRDIYKPMISRLSLEGINAIEKSVIL